MKKKMNLKKLLNATIAFSAFVLVGCTGSAQNDEWSYAGEPVQEQDFVYQDAQEEFLISEEVWVSIEEDLNEEGVTCAQENVQEEKTEPKENKRALASSAPVALDAVPTKPLNKCIESQTVDCPYAKKQEAPKTVKKAPTSKPADLTVVDDVKVKQKPQVAPTPVVDEVSRNSVAQVVVPTKPEIPVIETTIANNEKAADSAKKDFAVVDEIITENDEVVLEMPNAAELEAKKAAEKARQEELAALKKAREAAELAAKAEEEKYATAKAQLEQEKAQAEAEKMRLQKEMEELEATRKSLEEEKLRISQIQTSAPESCEDIKDWVASEGTTLRSLLMEWGNKVGWRVVWNMDRDYTLEAGAVFRGRFVDVAAALLRSFARATPAPKGVFYKGNKVLVISTREDENAD
ncbi:MAG: hypothetical protein E7013_00745 [Alphaproteobacteria bacterium]|nr:hypothetical protein [Alphaproteobacteria bacterium]